MLMVQVLPIERIDNQIKSKGGCLVFEVAAEKELAIAFHVNSTPSIQ